MGFSPTIVKEMIQTTAFRFLVWDEYLDNGGIRGPKKA